jgi:HEPN domain-containing protein
MPNSVYAKEWLQFAYRNLFTAVHLYEVNHFTDIIVIDLQQALEKMLKATLAYDNKKIPKSHFLDELASLSERVTFNDNELLILEKTTDYYREDRYPNPNYSLPTRQETKEILDFANTLFDRICETLKISQESIVHVK